MIDCVMILNRPWPFIFIGWGVLPRKETLYKSKFARIPQFYSDSGSTSQTGQAHRSDRCGRWQAVQGHLSDRWRQPDRLCANFGCEQMYCVF
jgi:hypothetical protein